MREWNAAMDHIEANLTGEITGGELARIALTSEYHFRRMFATLAGLPLSEYIRRRRMTVAAPRIIAGEPVLDVAIAYGYGSADAFTRAFRAAHGLTPSQARVPGAVLRSQSAMTFHLQVEGSSDVEYRIIDKEAFRIVGLTTRVPLIHLGQNDTIVEFERSIPRTAAEQLEAISDVDPLGTLGVTAYLEDPREDTEVDYWHAVATTAGPPAGFDSLEVPAGQWVVLTAEGPVPEALQELWKTAATEWFPANPYRWAPGPQLLSTTLDDGGSTGRGDLWIPIEPE